MFYKTVISSGVCSPSIVSEHGKAREDIPCGLLVRSVAPCALFGGLRSRLLLGGFNGLLNRLSGLLGLNLGGLLLGFGRLLGLGGLQGLLGLAEKAGKVRSGEFSTEKAVKSGKAGLVIVSEESSDNTKKMFRNMCTYYKVPYFEFGSKEELGHILGKQMRASLAVIDENFSNALLKHFTAKA